MTTAMVDVERVPARSEKTFVGINDRMVCGIVVPATLSERVCSASIFDASTVPCVKSAPASPESAIVAQPNTAAMATVPRSTTSTEMPILPRFSVASVRVNAPTIATKISGITSILSRLM